MSSGSDEASRNRRRGANTHEHRRYCIHGEDMCGFVDAVYEPCSECKTRHEPKIEINGMEYREDKTLLGAKEQQVALSLSAANAGIRKSDVSIKQEPRKTFYDPYSPKKDHQAAITCEVSRGTKHDSGKPQLSLVPTELLESTARAMEYGASLYGRDNWRKGFTYSRLIDAALRHIQAFKDGEDAAQDSGVSHLGHAAANLGFLLSQIAHNTGMDDRYKK